MIKGKKLKVSFILFGLCTLAFVAIGMKYNLPAFNSNPATITKNTSSKSSRLAQFQSIGFKNVQKNANFKLKNEIIFNDTPRIKFQDTTPKKIVVDTFPLKISKDTFSGPIHIVAEDSMVIDVPNQMGYLYGTNTGITYQGNEITAPYIQYDHKTGIVMAHLIKDSLGNIVSMPAISDQGTKSVSDTIYYNIKTGKGITKGTYTKQGEMYVYSEKIKRANPDIFYGLNVRMTTCNLDTPHFAFVSNKIKFITNKMAYSGPVHPEFEGVPVYPIVLPFGIFPLNQDRHSGLLAPTFETNFQMGLGLRDLGYYKIMNDNWDLITRASIYSYGGWQASLNPRYLKRYRYQGNLMFEMQRMKFLDQKSDRTFKVLWSHNMDEKSKPGTRFSANVNAGSTKYNQQYPSSPRLNVTNMMASSINYSKNWQGKPYNLSLVANHNQNSNTNEINVTLPNASFNVSTIYPFRKKEFVGEPKWYENLGIGLNTNVRSSTKFNDTIGRIGRQILDNYQWGAAHSIPLSISLPPLGPLQISPSISYSENWYQKKLLRTWNSNLQKVDSISRNGFFAAREMSFGMNASTRIFGMFGFRPSSKIQAIRHELRPSLGFRYKPDMNKQFWQDLQIDNAGNKIPVSVFDGNINSAFARGKFGGIDFRLENILSMKVKQKGDTSKEALKKVNLLDGFDLGASYNLLADSFKLSPITLNARTNLFEKVGVTGSAAFDPYQIGPNGRALDKLIWSKKPISLGRLTNANISLQTSLKGGNKKNKVEPGKLNNGLIDTDANGYPINDRTMEEAYIRNNPGEYVDFEIPWSIDLGYSLRYYNTLKYDYSGFQKTFSQDLNINASMNLTPKWKLGAQGFYNITENQFNNMSIYLSREMHCWQMAINIAPIGKYRYLNISINPKSPILRDLKVNRNRSYVEF